MSLNAQLRQLKALESVIKIAEEEEDWSTLVPLSQRYDKLMAACCQEFGAILRDKGRILMETEKYGPIAFALPGRPVPAGYVVYTPDEIEAIEGRITPMMHEAKRLGGQIEEARHG